MSKWDMVRLGDIGNFQSGGTPSRSHPEYFGGHIPWITTVALNGGVIGASEAIDFLTDEGLYKSAAKLVPSNSIMIGTRVGVGKAAVNSVPMSTNQDIISITEIDNTSWDTKYIMKCLIALAPYFVSQARGATIQGIKLDTLKDVLIKCVPLSEQRKIVSMLDKISGLIAERKAQLEQLDLLVKSQFIEMFGDGQSFESVKLKEVASIAGGLTKNESKRKHFDLKVPYLRVANVFYNHLDLSEVLELPIDPSELEKGLLQMGDLLFVEGNGSIEQVGRVAIWNGAIDPCVHQNHLIKARCDRTQIDPVYALFFNMLPDGRKQIMSKAVSTSGLHTLSVSKVENLEIPLPPLALQTRFAEFVRAADKSKFAIKQGLEKMELLYKALMQQWFTPAN